VLFSSITFIFYFLPLVICGYFIIPEKYLRIRNGFLLLASLIFYSWGEPVYVFLMIYSAFFNYFMALEIKKEQKRGGSGKRNLAFTIGVNLFILGFFKYFGFLMETVNGVFGVNIHYTALALPIGISFYTFQALSYIFDVYSGKVSAQRSFLKFALYLSFFPQLIAGPIVKYRDIEKQLSERTTSVDTIGQGAIRFMLGLGKKVLLANNLGALHTAVLALSGDEVSVATYWMGIVAYTLQIYFDFSGYSDMAIGLGKIFGFTFNENFDHPYISKSVTEFWRRWHISLSSWFREYLYYPLGGNRKGVSRHIINLFIVWALTGLWHGASWNFVFWGIYYCIVLILEKYAYGRFLEKAPGILRHIYAMLIVMVGWVFFSSTSLPAAFEYLKTAFFLGGKDIANMTTLFFLRTNLMLLATGVLMSTKAPINWFRKFRKRFPLASLLIVYFIMLLSVAYLVYSSFNPFLYFRF